MEVEALAAELIRRGGLTRGVLSKPRSNGTPRRVTVRPVALREGLRFQFTTEGRDRATDENLPPVEAETRLRDLLGEYRQALLQSADADFQVLGGTKVLRRPPTRPAADPAHDRRKRHVLEAGRPDPFLVELGVMDAQGRVKAKRQGKFRQINRFLELVADVVPRLPRDRPVEVVDFGSGRSYLTFALYHYLQDVEGLEVSALGLDLKEDVIRDCSALVRRLRYDGLRFEVGDIAHAEQTTPIDLVVSLHACDTATDLALERAVRWQAGVIMAVPCCQHELLGQIRSEQLAPLLRHGVLKERVAALATDAARAQLLELVGYRTQVLEFVETEHTPKNLLLRAVRRSRPATQEQAEAYLAFRDDLAIDPLLERLLRDRLGVLAANGNYA
jgi:SAM-dependent methyltransferase